LQRKQQVGKSRVVLHIARVSSCRGDQRPHWRRIIAGTLTEFSSVHDMLLPELQAPKSNLSYNMLLMQMLATAGKSRLQLRGCQSVICVRATAAFTHALIQRAR
jgi:hypothetical protein